MLRLLVSSAAGTDFEHTVKEHSVVIGRSSKADLMIADRSLSREHARLFKSDDGWMVEDLGSRNGTLLNGVGIREPKPMQLGDVLVVGASSVRFREVRDGERDTGDSLNASGVSLFKPSSDLLEQGFSIFPEDDQEESEVHQYAARLRILHEVHQALARSIDQDELLGMILDRIFEHLRPQEGAIFLRDGETFRCAAQRAIRGGNHPPLYSKSLIREVADKDVAALVLDTATDERFNEAASLLNAGVRSLVAAPLSDPGGALGMIVLGSKISERQFNEEDMALLNSLASVAAMRIRNVRLVAEAMERQRLEQEVALARQIQVALLPDALPKLDGYQLYGGNLPSRGVSGDFYKVIERAGGAECVFLLADVSGKGVAASLLTASIEALSASLLEEGLAPDEVFSKVSRLLYQRTPSAKFATAFLAVLNPVDGSLVYSNAGHNPGLLVKADGESEWLAPTGMPLGIMPTSTYTTAEIKLKTGDTFLIYTDGLTEAEDPSEEQYGEKRMLEAALRNCKLDPADMAAAMEDDLEQFVKGVPFADDRTLLILRKTGG